MCSSSRGHSVASAGPLPLQRVRPDPLYPLIAFRYRRCVHLLAKNKLTQTHIQARFLAGQSLVESKQWDECINLLGDEVEPESKNADETKVPHT